jgi:uncharacterized coiled-coil protein SlyX
MRTWTRGLAVAPGLILAGVGVVALAASTATPATLEERVAAHDATLEQINARLGSIDTRLTSLEAGLRELTGRVAERAEVLALVLGLGGWVTLLIGLQTVLSRRSPYGRPHRADQ